MNRISVDDIVKLLIKEIRHVDDTGIMMEQNIHTLHPRQAELVD